MQRMFIPPGGFLGSSSQTMAGQLGGAARGSGAPARTRARRRSRVRKVARTARRVRRAARTARRFVKGSAAAKRYMAKLRRMRRK